MTVRVTTGLLDRFVIESLPGRLALTACVALVAPAALAAGDARLVEHFAIGWLFVLWSYGSAVTAGWLAWATGEARALEFARTLRRLLGPLVWGVLVYAFVVAAVALLFGAGALFPR